MLAIYDIICGWIIRFALFIPLVLLIVETKNLCGCMYRTEETTDKDGTIIFRKRHFTFKESLKELLHSLTWYGIIILIIDIILIVFSWVVLLC